MLFLEVSRKDMLSYIIEYSEQLTMTNVFKQPPESTKIELKCVMFDLMSHFNTECMTLIGLCLVIETIIYITQQKPS